MKTTNEPSPIYVDLPGVAQMISLSESTVEKLVREDRFPKPRLLSGRRVGYLVKEIEEWCSKRPVSDLMPPPDCGKRRAPPRAR